jgi:hypothetical protein
VNFLLQVRPLPSNFRPLIYGFLARKNLCAWVAGTVTLTVEPSSKGGCAASLICPSCRFPSFIFNLTRRTSAIGCLWLPFSTRFVRFFSTAARGLFSLRQHFLTIGSSFSAHWPGARTDRNPYSLSPQYGSSCERRAERQPMALPNQAQLPPRSTRRVPMDGPRGSVPGDEL